MRDIQSFKKKVADLLKLTKPSRLVVTRETDESIRVGDVVVTIVRVKGKQVRLGIICNEETKIDRLDDRGCLETKERHDGISDREAEGDSALG